MIAATPTLPGLYYRRAQVRAAPSPLRSDVAGFIGRTRRGEPGEVVRLEGWRDYVRQFGPLDHDAPLSYAVRGYFENGGNVAYVVRVADRHNRIAKAHWQVALNASGSPPTSEGFRLEASATLRPGEFCYTLEATSPGVWADGMRVSIRYSCESPIEKADSRVRRHLEFRVQASDEPVERFRVPIAEPTVEAEVAKRSLEAEVAQRSNLIRLKLDDSRPIQDLATDAVRRAVPWDTLVLRHAVGRPSNAPSGVEGYRASLAALCDEPEVALLALPGIHCDDTLDGRQRLDILDAAIACAAELQDRLVIVDVGPGDNDLAEASTAEAALDFVSELRRRLSSPANQRAVAVYHPWLRVDDPLGSSAAPLWTVPPSGHIAGVISRLDRERGAHHTPANVPVQDVVDIETAFGRDDVGQLSQAGVNLVRCIPGRGLLVWGGRTLDISREGRFVGHRRFLHRLVRAVRRVAEPLVFDTNGPELWLILVHAVSTVLLEAFRNGALQGDRPEEAFRVRCDDQTNSPAVRGDGRVVCEIKLALAAPMEFITLRITVSQAGQVEVFDE